MQPTARRTLGVVIVAAAAIGLGACSPSERKEVRTEAKQVTSEAKQVTSAAAGAIDNAALTTKVKAALLADELVKGTQINVESSSGVVTLNGTVDSMAHKQKAEQIASNVSGVARVQNNLTAK